MNWITPIKPAEAAEESVIEAILTGHFPIDSNLPGERELASQLGVTRPTLREALQRLAKDGWIEIRQGKPTRVRNFWQEGNLGVLSTLAHRPQNLPPDFVANLLYIRCLMAPDYTRLAAEHGSQQLQPLLENFPQATEPPQVFADYDWQLHHLLTIASGNPIFTLILNGFKELYPAMAIRYFESSAARQSSHNFYQQLAHVIKINDPSAAEQLTRRVMLESLDRWRDIDPTGANYA